ncbi:histidine--tRNA ligase [Xylocopilactobacillus apicola]|uniref:Histidine--tRNA ligase n=1 Tax=Xylocopilactobacillus apicola TaxID=2932184 RepID=A0AAU9DQG9_9LACO|nr:histidine--tRNA ligase [Xylocopilactobacillus apicola]BDR58129.1 histidine--tRNA ligase [Xylocopilactobacillus apicola]
MVYQRPKGTNDVLPQEAVIWQKLENTERQIAAKFGYSEIRVPIFENLNLFQRSAGETSDVVAKEMYEFTDKGNRKMALRPEGTAGVVRAYIENKLFGPEFAKPFKVYYLGPMFRYERPQSGRSRQFNQFGVEAFGVEDPRLDAETITLAVEILKTLEITEVKVALNTLGDQESRQAYEKALVDYLTPYEAELSEDSKIRLVKNPLRILDSKDPTDQKIVADAPKIIDYLTDSAAQYFEEVKKYLALNGIDFVIDEELVRGLDYYNHTIFELIYTGDRFGGSELTLIAGGRYNQLVEELGGPATPGVGFGLGEERLIEILAQNEDLKEELQPEVDLFLVGVEEESVPEIFQLANTLRERGLSVAYDYTGRSLKSQFKLANRLKSRYTIVIGSKEIADKVYRLKKMSDGTEFELALKDITKGRLED